MKWCLAVFFGVSVAMGQNAPNVGKSAAPLPQALASILMALKGRSSLAVMLPGKLPQPIANAKYGVVDDSSGEKYAVSLYYQLGVGDSGFAAAFMADAHPDVSPKELGDEVKLAGGLVGYFRPVSCGGSCAPANLWWEEKGVLYQIQFKLSPKLRDRHQKELITVAANSAILAGPR